MPTYNPLDPTQTRYGLANDQQVNLLNMIGNSPTTTPTWLNDPWLASQQMSLYDPETLRQLQTIFAPYQQQIMANLTKAQGTALGQASRGAGAYAASQGYDNPFTFQERAKSNVYSQYAPQFGNLQSDFMSQLLGAGSQSSQFGRQGLLARGNQMWNNAQFNEQQRQYDDQSGFNFFRDMLPGIVGGVGSIASAGIGRSNNPWF